MSRRTLIGRDPVPLLTVGEVAARLRVSDDTIRRRINDGSLASLRLAGVIRIPLDEVDRILAQAATPRIIE